MHAGGLHCNRCNRGVEFFRPAVESVTDEVLPVLKRGVI